MERFIWVIGGFFYRLFGYGRVADTHYDVGYERGYIAGLHDGFQDAVDNVQDWHMCEKPTDDY